MAEQVTIYEVGPRDGLQNETRLVPAAEKIALVDLLSQTGLGKIEVTSFVSPKWVPQMADAGEVLDGIKRVDGVTYAALTPNSRGLDGALAHRADEVAVFASASEGFSQKNINCTVAESVERFVPVVEAARGAGIKIRGYVSCITDCPYDGLVEPAQVAVVVKALLALGCYEVSLGDTIGAATPERVDALLVHLLDQVPAAVLAGHFHDTRSRALDNIEVCLGHGLRTFDASVAGLGGCPYAPGAKGNVATEAVYDLMTRSGYETGIDRAALEVASQMARTIVG